MESQYKVQIVVNYGTSIEMKGDIVPIYFSSYFIEKVDSEFPDVKLNWNDYYPALGNKTIVVRGVNKDENGEPIPLTGKVKAEVIYPTPGMDLYSSVSVTPLEATFADGRVEFSLSAQNIAPPINGDVKTGLDKIEIRFNVFDDEDNDIGHIDGKWNIKNNSNTNLKEVLDGKAVFVCDLQRDSDGNFVINDGKYVARTGVNHKGASTGGSNSEKEVDFLQELINQVVPRKRTLNATYELMTEDGYFGETTADGVGMFKTNFSVDNVTSDEEIFQKIIKDYNLEGNPGFWEDKVVDKSILAGQTLRIDSDNNPDILINNSPGNMVNDTGLYELYDNVVRKFVQNLINLADSYRTNSNPDNDPHQWISRTGDIIQTTQGSNQAVAYSYGGRQTISAFNDSVSKHGAPSYANIENTPAYSAYQNYHGNIGDALDTESDPIKQAHGIVGTGNKMWPGLLSGSEYNAGIAAGDVNHRYYHENWAGVDCIGFTLNTLRYANDPATYAADQMLTTVGDTQIPGVVIGGVCVDDVCDNPADIDTRNALFNVNVSRFFNYTKNPDLMYYWVYDANMPSTSVELIHKGDVVRYTGGGVSHITMIYSNKWGESQFDMKIYPINYDIIHAYGFNTYHGNFSRKVIITGNDITIPTGFGRIKLWD